MSYWSSYVCSSAVAFEEALPPLSDDLDAPLEAMPALDQPQTVQQVPGVPAATAQEELGAAPAQDPELAQPRPQLATFDATPPAELADEGRDGKADRKSTRLNSSH